MSDEEIKKALECCVIGNCRRCPLDCVHNCRTVLREGMHDIVNKQQLELVVKRNTINDLNNKLTEKQSENDKLQNFCASKDVIIKEQQTEIERLQNTLDDVLNRQPLLIERSEKYVIKEFAERLKKKKLHIEDEGQIFRMVHCYEIDNLLTEMVGGMNEKNN